MKHKIYLLDRCPVCEASVLPYLSCQSGRLGACFKCEKPLYMSAGVEPATSDVLFCSQKVLSILDQGFAMIEGRPVYSVLFFKVFHQVLRLFLNRSVGPRFRQMAKLTGRQMETGGVFETTSLGGQACLIVGVGWLLEGWPRRGLKKCEEYKILSSTLLRDMENAPFWYWRTVMDNLYRPDRVVSVDEIQSAICYMESQGMAVSEAAISRFFGFQQVFRK